jgi:hypothetical protein
MKSSFHLAAFAVLSGTAASLLSAAPAKAFVVNFSGSLYDVSVLETSYDSSTSSFALPPLGKMPWWGSQPNADFFAEQVFSSLGEGSTIGYGPLFAYTYDSSIAEVMGSLQDLSAPGSLTDGTATASATVKFAIATETSFSPVPGPLPLFGVTAAFGLSRQLRRRIRIR